MNRSNIYFETIRKPTAIDDRLERDIAETVAKLQSEHQVRDTVAFVVLGMFIGIVAMFAGLFIG